ncbi:MAG: hypothetical protein ACKO3T_10340 [Planctomycetaceae bacterium]
MPMIYEWVGCVCLLWLLLPLRRVDLWLQRLSRLVIFLLMLLVTVLVSGQLCFPAQLRGAFEYLGVPLSPSVCLGLVFGPDLTSGQLLLVSAGILLGCRLLRVCVGRVAELPSRAAGGSSERGAGAVRGVPEVSLLRGQRRRLQDIVR